MYFVVLLQVFDVGESRAMPIEFPEEASGFRAWRTFALAAGLADAVSRTVTAPIDRFKTQLQVSSTARCLIVTGPPCLSVLFIQSKSENSSSYTLFLVVGGSRNFILTLLSGICLSLLHNCWPKTLSCLRHRFMDRRPSPGASRRRGQAVCARCGKATLLMCWKERHSQHYNASSMLRWARAAQVFHFELFMLSFLPQSCLALSRWNHTPKAEPWRLWRCSSVSDWVVSLELSLTQPSTP